MLAGPVTRSWPELGAQGNPAQRAPQASERANPDGGGDATADRTRPTDTTDTVLRGNPANKGNYRNCSRRSDSLVTSTNAGYYDGSVGIKTR
jgi:hypothetical protein